MRLPFGEPLFLCADAQPRLPCGQKSVTFGISALVLDFVGNDPIVKYAERMKTDSRKTKTAAVFSVKNRIGGC